MDFRCAALIALWTLFVGPILAAPSGGAAARKAPAAATGKAVHVTAHVHR